MKAARQSFRLFCGPSTLSVDFRSPLPAPRRSSTSSAASASPRPKDPSAMTVFDRKAKALQRDRAALREDHEIYDYLREEIGYRTYDRLLDIKRTFDLVVDLSAGKGFVGKNLTKDTCKRLIQCDISREMLARSSRPEDPEVELKNLLIDEDETLQSLPFDDNSVDVVVSSLGLHWVNDLPGCFRNVWRCLKPDSPFLGAMFGGETLFELRCSLQQAELERRGGFSPRISPFVQMQDVGSLLTRTGFKMLTVDTDEIVVGYPSMFELMGDLKGMAENNASLKRSLHLSRDSIFAAAAVYQAMYGRKDEAPDASSAINATFQIVSFIGWKPGPNQPKPAQRGSATASLKDIEKFASSTAETETPVMQENIDQFVKDLRESLAKSRQDDDGSDGKKG